MVKRIIPCLDVKGGRVVKGINFTNIRDAGDPVLAAKAYCDAGADELAFLDISATLEERETLIDMVSKVAEQVSVPFTVGGGIRSIEDIRRILNAGADKVSLNSAAVLHPELVQEAATCFGSPCVIVAIDVQKDVAGNYEVITRGGTYHTGLEAVDWAKKAEALGAGEILLTSMDKDGTRSGYDLEITKQVAEAVSVPVIASGGAGCLKDFYDAIVVGQADAVLAAGLFHFGDVAIPNLKRYLALRGIPVRLPREEQNILSCEELPERHLPAGPDAACLIWQKLKKDPQGLVPVVVRDVSDGTLYMQAFMDEEALYETLDSGLMHFHSRSRNKLWLKGERSGHFQQVFQILSDCDADSLLADVRSFGPACHTGHRSCFYRPLDTLLFDEGENNEPNREYFR